MSKPTETKNPSYIDMITEALTALDDKKGSSKIAIEKFIGGF